MNEDIPIPRTKAAINAAWEGVGNYGLNGVINRISDHAAELERELAATGWQPIDAAPKDGTEVLAAAPRFNNPDIGSFQVVARFQDGLWVAGSEEQPYQIWPPTHFRPLPPPPTPEVDDQDCTAM